MSLLLNHRLSLPPNLYLLVKALLTIEGLGRMLDPGFDLVSVLDPFLKASLASRLDPLKAGSRSADSLLGYLSLAADLPAEIRSGLQQLRQGRLKLEFQGDDLEKILHKADKISNRLAFALIVTGGLVARPWPSSRKSRRSGTTFPSSPSSAFWGAFSWGSPC